MVHLSLLLVFEVERLPKEPIEKTMGNLAFHYSSPKVEIGDHLSTATSYGKLFDSSTRLPTSVTEHYCTTSAEY